MKEKIKKCPNCGINLSGCIRICIDCKHKFKEYRCDMIDCDYYNSGCCYAPEAVKKGCDFVGGVA